MDNDMMSKLMDIIGSPDAKEKLLNTISAMQQDSGADSGYAPKETSNPFDMLSADSINLFYKIQNILEKLNSKDDSRIGLLNSMKPFMRDSRSKNIDNAIRFIQILNFARSNMGQNM